MHMKYFQPLANMLEHWEHMLELIDKQPYGPICLEGWGVNPDEKAALIEEREVLRYLVGLRHTFVDDTRAVKPDIETANRCFERHLFFLNKIFDLNADNWRTHTAALAVKRYQACCHYLFKFSLPAWYDKLPDYVPTFEEKQAAYKDRQKTDS